jgi:hypothetical protein
MLFLHAAQAKIAYAEAIGDYKTVEAMRAMADKQRADIIAAPRYLRCVGVLSFPVIDA